MVDALGDPHTSYLDPDEFRQLNMSLEGEYEGIGAWVDTTTEFLTIVSPMPGSPAEEAGLLPGDEVIAINGEDMTGIDGDLVVRRVLGPAGSEVTLTIRREGKAEPFDVTVKRANITVPSVESKMLDSNIAYIALFDFGANTTSELRDALKSLLEKNPTGLVLDLRNNPGGYLQTAVEVASEFIPDGDILQEQTGDGKIQIYSALGNGLAYDIPLVILVNDGSASASEILAGAVQDHGRGKLVGITTYGKGSVQLPIELKDGQGMVRVTIARWLTPNGRQINEVGLEPDYKVELTQQDLEAGRDPQLDKAIELLQQPE
jgi:carboxyl-terminal processing protease